MRCLLTFMCFWLWRPGTASSGSGGVQASFLAMAARRPEDERACASCKDKARVDVEVTGCKINQNTVYLCKGMKGYYNEKTWFEKGTLAKPVSMRAIWRSPRLMRVNGQITRCGLMRLARGAVWNFLPWNLSQNPPDSSSEDQYIAEVHSFL